METYLTAILCLCLCFTSNAQDVEYEFPKVNFDSIVSSQVYESQSYPITGQNNFINVLPSVIQLLSTLFEKEKYEPILEENAFNKKVSNIKGLNKDFRKGNITLCQYLHLQALAFNTDPPNCSFDESQ